MCAFCIECASQPKPSLSLHIKGPSYCRLTVERRVQWHINKFLTDTLPPCLSDYMTREAKRPGESLSNSRGAQSMEAGRKDLKPS